MDLEEKTRAVHRVSQETADELWTHLDRHHRGRDRAVRQADLAKTFGLNVRALQYALEYLAYEGERPVATSCRKPMGVYVATTAQEKLEYALQLEHRIISLARRLRSVTRTPLVHVSVQRRLPMEAPQ